VRIQTKCYKCEKPIVLHRPDTTTPEDATSLVQLLVCEDCSRKPKEKIHEHQIEPEFFDSLPEAGKFQPFVGRGELTAKLPEAEPNIRSFGKSALLP